MSRTGHMPKSKFKLLLKNSKQSSQNGIKIVSFFCSGSCHLIQKNVKLSVVPDIATLF